MTHKNTLKRIYGDPARCFYCTQQNAQFILLNNKTKEDCFCCLEDSFKFLSKKQKRVLMGKYSPKGGKAISDSFFRVKKEKVGISGEGLE